jgi:hypothetical protein
MLTACGRCCCCDRLSIRRLFTLDLHHTSLKEFMAKQKSRRRREVAEPTVFEQARDELFQHIMRCEVIGAEPDHQVEWFGDTMRYLGERYHELSEAELKDLRTLGERFAAPPKTKTPEVDAASAA